MISLEADCPGAGGHASLLISNYTSHLAQTPLDPFMKGAEWSAPGKLKPAA
jgi:hypothetical protein